MEIQHFFDEHTWTVSYVVHDGATAVVIDPIRDYDPSSGRTTWRSAERIAAYLDGTGLRLVYAIDTHVHADHMSGLPYFRQRYGAQTATGARVGEVQRIFRDFYNLGAAFPVDGRQFDVLLEEGGQLRFGSLTIDAIHTPGHTPAHMSWRIGNSVFLGDTLFMPDYGAARCDFPGGSAADLYESIQRIYRMPGHTRLFVGHDYLPGGRPLAFQTTVDEQRRHNVQVAAHTTQEEFVALRKTRDAALGAPALILPSLQVNIRGGELPEAESDGIAYLKIPLNVLGGPS